MEGLARGANRQNDGGASSSSSPLQLTAASATAAAAAAVPQWIGGRLAAFSEQWEEILGSAALVETGWTPEWVDDQPQHRRILPLAPPLQQTKHAQMLNAIDEELRAGVIRRIPRELIKWEHPSHLIPKKDGRLRKIMNASAFNKHMLKIKFKLEDQRLLMQLLQRNMFATSVDITSVASWVQPYLCFNYDSKTY
jgi:hypothetical protein